MSKGKQDGIYVNLSQDHELSGFLNRRGYKGDLEARNKLIKLVKSMKGTNTRKNIRWSELDVHFKAVASSFEKI